VYVAVTRVPARVDNQASVVVTDVNRAFFLRPDRRPGRSFLAMPGLGVRLTAEAPTASVWSRTRSA
jgi:hypothetical protein